MPLKSQKRLYWIGGGLWAVLMLTGAGMLVIGGGGGDGWGGFAETEVFAHGDILAAAPEVLEARAILAQPAGEIDLAGGGLVLTDPLDDPGRAPFVLDVQPGRYPVTLYTPDPPGRVVGLAVVELGEGPVLRWEEAERDEGWLEGLGLGVHEVVALGDAGAVARLEPGALRAALAESGALPHRAEMEVPMPEGPPLKVVVFDPDFELLGSGSYVGFDAGDRPVRLVKDFGYFGQVKAFGER